MKNKYILIFFYKHMYKDKYIPINIFKKESTFIENYLKM